jgi:hypothetical protein
MMSAFQGKDKLPTISGKVEDQRSTLFAFFALHTESGKEL